MKQHKCRVFKAYWPGFDSGRKVWLMHCYNQECYYYKAYVISTKWNIAILEAVHHSVINK